MLEEGKMHWRSERNGTSVTVTLLVVLGIGVSAVISGVVLGLHLAPYLR